MLKIDGSNLIKEFDVKTAKENIGGEIEINACVHKVRQMSEFANEIENWYTVSY